MTNLSSVKELKSAGVTYKLITLTQAVHSVLDVHKACNCGTSEVIKTLVFIGNTPIIVMIPGDKMADIKKIKCFIEEQELCMAKPPEVLHLTGYEVGAVSPFGLKTNIKQIADRHILDLPFLYLGSGKSNILIKISQEEFRKSFQGDFVAISN